MMRHGLRIIESVFVPVVETEEVVVSYSRSFLSRLLSGCMVDLVIQHERQAIRIGDSIVMHPDDVAGLKEFVDV